MVGATTLVAGGGTIGTNGVEAAIEATTEAARSATTANRRSAHTRSRAVAGNVAHLPAGIAATASGASGDAQSRAISLDVTKTLAMIALFG